MTQTIDTVNVKISTLADLAVELWRLERWAFQSGFERDRSLARHAARKLASFLTGMEFELSDLTGQPYDPGLAVEVIDTEHEGDSADGEPTVAEMLAPIVLWRGRVVRAGQVLIRFDAATIQEVRE